MNTEAHGRSVLARYGLSLGDGLVVGIAFVLCIAFGPTMSYPSWTPRMAIVLAMLPVGVVALARQAVRGDRAGRWAVGLIVWIVVAGFASGFPRSALIGFVARDLSALLVIGCIAIWAIAREVGDRARRVLVPAVLIGLGLGLLVGVLQLLLDVESGTFAMNGGRPTGFTTNPVYFGGLMIGAGMLCAAIASEPAAPDSAPPVSRRIAVLVATGVFALGASISGSRVSILALVLLAGALLVWRRRAAIVPAVVLAVGVVVGSLVQRGAGSSTDALSRAGDGGGGLDGRLQVWRYALSAIGDKPIFGWGFGRFQASIQGDYDADFVRTYAQRDLGVAWFDAHNVVVGVVDAIGVIGLALVVIWVVVGGRRCDRRLVVFPAALLVTWMLQPPALPTLPLAALLFGAACRRPDAAPGDDTAQTMPRAARIDVIAVALGIVASLYLVAADVAFYAATESLDGEASERIAAFYPGDPVVAGLMSQVWAIDTDDNTSPEAIEWQERAVTRDPERPYWRARLAERYLLADRYDDAWAQLDRALELQPFHVDSVRLRVVVAARMQDEERVRAAIEMACAIEAPECELDVDELLERARP